MFENNQFGENKEVNVDLGKITIRPEILTDNARIDVGDLKDQEKIEIDFTDTGEKFSEIGKIEINLKKLEGSIDGKFVVKEENDDFFIELYSRDGEIVLSSPLNKERSFIEIDGSIENKTAKIDIKSEDLSPEINIEKEDLEM